MTNTTKYEDIGRAVDALCARLGHPETLVLSIYRWEVALHTHEAVPGVEYTETTSGDSIVLRATVAQDGVKIELVCVEKGKVVRA